MSNEPDEGATILVVRERRVLVVVWGSNAGIDRAFLCAKNYLGRVPAEMLEELWAVCFEKYTHRPLLMRRSTWGVSGGYTVADLPRFPMNEYMDKKMQDGVHASMVDPEDRDRMMGECLRVIAQVGIVGAEDRRPKPTEEPTGKVHLLWRMEGTPDGTTTICYRGVGGQFRGNVADLSGWVSPKNVTYQISLVTCTPCRERMRKVAAPAGLENMTCESCGTVVLRLAGVATSNICKGCGNHGTINVDDEEPEYPATVIEGSEESGA